LNEFLAALLASPGKRVALAELRHHYFSLYPDVQNSPDRGARLLAALRELEAQGAISMPAVGSWEKVGAPPLPKWVTIARASSAPQTENLANIPWVPELGFWPELRPVQLPTLRVINDFLLRRRGQFLMTPIKERSLEVFGDEKRLDEMCTGDSLFGGRLHLRTLGCFRVPQPLPYRASGASGLPVLVVENHNTYWSFGEWNQSVRRYSAIVYGEGQNFRLTGRALHQVMTEVGADRAEYFGDLDPKGVSIPFDFNKNVEPGYPTVHAALGLYRWLLANGIRRTKPECKGYNADIVRDWLNDELASELEALWAAGEWLPQEALGFEQLSSIGNAVG
jgi:Uncharacterized protein conserved in bacteria C-term(DUF2220)